MKTRAFTAVFAAIALSAMSTAAMAQTGTRATFNVYKLWSDNNTGDITVHINCTTGDPISSSRTFASLQNPIEFIVKDFTSGNLDCLITEEEVDGYTVDYEAGDGGSDTDDGVDGCRYQFIADDPATNEDPSFTCEIRNRLDRITVWIGKEWIDDLAIENGNFFFARAVVECDRFAPGHLPGVGEQPVFTDNSAANGLYDQDSVSFWPHFEGTTCSVFERETDSDIMTDTSDCAELEFFPGYEADLDANDRPIPECVLVNTRIYAGIPTLSEYGLALLALLMLGVGFVGYRRFA